jgi:ribonuclease HI
VYTAGGPLPPATTVFEAELFAVWVALTAAPPDAPVTLIVDSQAALAAVQRASEMGARPEAQGGRWAAWATLVQIVLLLRVRRVVLQWTKAHVGHQLNEAADERAKEAAVGHARIWMPPEYRYPCAGVGIVCRAELVAGGRMCAVPCDRPISDERRRSTACTSTRWPAVARSCRRGSCRRAAGALAGETRW